MDQGGTLGTVRRVAAHVRRHALRDGALILASGVAFDGLLALLPFLLLVVAVASLVLPVSPGGATADVAAVAARLIPDASDDAHALLASVLEDIVRTRAELGLVGALGFVWFSSRLFATLRMVMARVFAEPEPRTGLRGLIYDLWLTLVAAAFGAGWVLVSALMAAVGAAGGRVLEGAGRADWRLPATAEFLAAHALTAVFATAIFYALYRTIPRRRVPRPSVLVAATCAGLAFEAARWIFGAVWRSFGAMSVYTGTVAAVVVVMFWAWYAALIFILGGEILEGLEWERTGEPPAAPPPPSPLPI